MTIKFYSEARKEFFEAGEYYEEYVVGLRDNFIDEVEKRWMLSINTRIRGLKS